jgi:alpha-tubulin suppressor-like RCC1 family protein
LVLKKIEGINEIMCGVQISFYSQNGKIYSCGCNEDGELGHGDKKDRSKFKQIKGLSNVERFHTAGHHVIAEMGNFDIYVWGRNENGQLGLGHKKIITFPTKLEFTKKKVYQVVCGNRSTYICTAK